MHKRTKGEEAISILLTPFYTIAVVLVVTLIKILMLPLIILGGFRDR